MTDFLHTKLYLNILSENIRVSVELSPSFAVEGGTDILQHPVHEVKNSIKSSKIVKNGPQIVKNENFQKNFFFCSFYVIMSLHAKYCVCRSNGVACGQYKDKEEKTLKKVKKGHKNVKKFRKTEKNLFSHSPKEHIFKKLAYWVENCDL